MTDHVVLCALEEVAEGGSKGFCHDKRGRASVLVVRRENDVHAYANVCPHHDRVRLGWRKDEFLNGDGSRIMCAAHGALFRREDGVCEAGPCMGQRLRGIRTKIKDGTVFAHADDLRNTIEIFK